MANLAQIYDWFMTGKKPTQAQFWAAWGSFWNKEETIPQSAISNLTTVLNAKTENDQFNAHKVAVDAHTDLFLGKEDKTQKGVAGGYVPLDEFSKIAHQFLSIVNNLTTGGTTSLLSAEQGVVLQTQIDAINTLLTSDDINLDTVQELVDAIKTVETSLETILVNDLTTGGTTKALTAEMGKLLQTQLNGKQASLGFTAENAANKVTDFATVNNDLFPSAQAVKTYISPYNGQTWGVIGDSFTQLNIFQPNLLYRAGVTTISDGIGGSCITGGTGNAEGDATYRIPMVDRIVPMLATAITGIIIQGGSNDFHYNIPLGKYGSTNVNEFYGALNFICEKIANHPTKLKALFITPTFRGDSQHGGSSTGLANWENMKPYVSAIKLVANKYSIQIVDEFGAGINFYNTDVYTTDGVHPNNVHGTELYTNFLLSNLNAGTLDVPTLDLLASYEVDPTFSETIYFRKFGEDLFDDAALVVTNGIDADFRIQVTAPLASNKRVSIGSDKLNVNIILAENASSKVGIGTLTPSEKLRVEGKISANELHSGDNSVANTKFVQINNGGTGSFPGSVQGVNAGIGVYDLALNPGGGNVVMGAPIPDIVNKLQVNGTMYLKTYTVSSLPAITAGLTAYATVTDAVAPTYLGALTGGGSVKCPVFFNGTVWVSH